MLLRRYTNVILPMHRDGRSAAIHRELMELDNRITYKQVKAFLDRFYGGTLGLRRKQYRLRKLAPHIEIIKKLMEHSYRRDSSTTIRQIIEKLRSVKINVGATQLKFIRKELGFRRASIKYCYLIREQNKQKRLEFCEEMLEQYESFEDCVFTDESTVQADCSVKYCFARKGDRFAQMRSRAKYPPKLHIWGGISMRGATEVAIFPGNLRMDSAMYCEIIERVFLRFNRIAYHGYAQLVHDNAPQHTSGFTTRKLEEWKVRTMDWPPESPDLNPVELVWGNMKSYIRKNARTVNDLRDAVLEYWRTLTPDVCRNYICGMRKKMERVVEQCGRNIYEGR
ncbi:hypothetical protein OESDEN_04647 [Oesophagostomum dentatum]|uniref:Tc1-like transposase DDE domain-containing protein n=1 Tax=Oesophagostomum dentatum TaxID=61180 RepID=A0A0B1THU7_OESDE|nr:hypothetical protein OESDEN_04647 [Oesophagostomum dentatum]